MRVASIMLGVVGAVVLVTSLITVMFFPLDSAFLLGKLAVGLAMVASSLILNWEGVREGVTKKNTAYVLSSIFLTTGFVGVLGVLNYVVVTAKTEIDLTKDKVFTLSDQSLKVAKDLKSDVLITAFYMKDSPEGQAVEDLVDRYRLETDRLKLELVNPEMHPDKVERYKVTEQSPRIIMETGGREVRLKEVNEEALTNALIQVATQERKKLYFTTGHGEGALEGETADGLKATTTDLRAEGYELDTLNLVDKMAIPADTAVLMVVNPRKPFLEPEARLVGDYLALGGKLILLTEPFVDTGLEAVLKAFNLELGNNMVLDATQFGQLLGQGPDAAIVGQYGAHPAVKQMEGLMTVFKSSRSVTKTRTENPGIFTTELAFSNPRSWGETNIQAGEWQWNDGEMRGPVSIMAVSTKDTKEAADKRGDEARVVVFGDAELAGNQFRQLGSNRDLLLNAVAYVAEDEQKISIRPRNRSASRIQLTPATANLIAFFALDGLPVTLLSVGLAIWLVRRRR